jgi:hypothetical protein
MRWREGRREGEEEELTGLGSRNRVNVVGCGDADTKLNQGWLGGHSHIYIESARGLPTLPINLDLQLYCPNSISLYSGFSSPHRRQQSWL